MQLIEAMKLKRRTLLQVLGAGAVAVGRRSVAQPAGAFWAQVRQQFCVSDDEIDLSALLIASHPAPVRAAIAAYRAELDEHPSATLLRGTNPRRREQTLEVAARYLGVASGELALTDSTTMGLGLVYGGLPLARGDEVITSNEDHYVTHEALRLAAVRTGAIVRRVRLFERVDEVTEASLVNTVEDAIGPRTRLVALTWVHSSTGLKLPVRQIAAMIARLNRTRPDGERVLLSIDGVHGFGIEDVELPKLGCDYFLAGCHKWLFGPRGTGIAWATRAAWGRLAPSIPSFRDPESWAAWRREGAPSTPTSAARMTPGGLKAFEHQWALREAFEFHLGLGKARVAARTHALCRQLKEGLVKLRNVRLITPMSEALSAGIVSFDVKGLSAGQATAALRRHRIYASVSPYAVPHVRVTPSIRNSPEELDRVLAAVQRLG